MNAIKGLLFFELFNGLHSQEGLSSFFEAYVHLLLNVSVRFYLIVSAHAVEVIIVSWLEHLDTVVALSEALIV